MKRLIILLLLFPAFLGKAYAEGPDEAAMRIFDTAQMESGLNPEEKKISGSAGALKYDAASAMSRLYASFAESLKTELYVSLDFAAELLGIVLFCAVGCSICAEEKIRRMMETGAVCASAAILLGKMDGLLSQTTEAIYRLSDYSRAALPVVYSAAAASGGVSTAALGYAGACLALDIMIQIVQKLMVGLICISLCLTLSNVLFPHPLLSSVEKLFKWASKTVLTLLILSFTAYLGTSTLISRNADAAALKAARTVISGSLPVVGGMLADASKAVLSAASVVLSCTGVFGLIAVCAICAGPFAVLTVKSFLLKVVTAAAEAVQTPRLEKLFSGFGSAMGMLMGILGACAIMLFLSFAAAMRVMTA